MSVLFVYLSNIYIHIFPTCILIISLLFSVAFSRGRLCENVLEGSSHYHVHAQRPGGRLLPGGQSRPAQQQTQTGLGVSFFSLFLHGEFPGEIRSFKYSPACDLESNLLRRVNPDCPVM